MGAPVNPEILIKAAVPSLRDGEINQSTQWSSEVADGQQGADGLDQVACPYQMVTSDLLVAFLVTPWDAERRNHRSRIRLVFVREQEIHTALEQIGISRSCRQHKSFRCTPPLPDKGLTRLFKRNAQGLSERTECIMPCRSECQTNREFRPPGKVEAPR